LVRLGPGDDGEDVDEPAQGRPCLGGQVLAASDPDAQLPAANDVDEHRGQVDLALQCPARAAVEASGRTEHALNARRLLGTGRVVRGMDRVGCDLCDEPCYCKLVVHGFVLLPAGGSSQPAVATADLVPGFCEAEFAAPCDGADHGFVLGTAGQAGVADCACG